ncbi:hypothetical protein Agub_g6807 [Astrephomene gubernaculifera]|uniref:EF-hand domain-containing protein n=1 Tax=Astrephomene gubernaculifera TaxID=47775 RepID=A0AAD3DRM6_9CHLO|nr:hypothetical protein Agub_g6807 [Astrephomene gubernaculifera]
MPLKPEEEAELRYTYDALITLLSDDSAFDAVLHAVFTNIDSKRDGTLDHKELQRYIAETCEEMGLEAPHRSQCRGIFRQLDLNDDNAISTEELGVFLRHFFQEQVAICALKLRPPRRP